MSSLPVLPNPRRRAECLDALRDVWAHSSRSADGHGTVASGHDAPGGRDGPSGAKIHPLRDRVRLGGAHPDPHELQESLAFYLILAVLFWPRETFSEEDEGFMTVVVATCAAPVGAICWAVVGWISAGASQPKRVFLAVLGAFLVLAAITLLLLV